MNLRDSLLAVLVALLWGLNFVAINLGLHAGGHDFPPLLFVAMRFVVVVFPWIFFIRKPDVSWTAIIGVGLFMSAGQFGLLYLAMALGMPAGLASLVLQAQVLLTVLLAAGFLGERPSRRQLAGVVLGVAGLALVAGGRSAVAPLLPLIIVLAAALSWAAGNVVARKAKAASGLGLVVWSGAVVPLPLAILSVLVDGPDTVWQSLAMLQAPTVLSALYTAIFASLVGYGIWNRLLASHPSSAVVPFTLLVPVVGTSWQVDDVDEVGRGASAMLAKDPARHVWGLGRHHIGSNFFWYLKDPAGNFSEYYADMDCIVDDQLWTPQDWTDSRALYSWGPPPPPSFLEPEDLAELMIGSHSG